MHKSKSLPCHKQIFQLLGIPMQNNTEGFGSTLAHESENTNFQWWLCWAESTAEECSPDKQNSFRMKASHLVTTEEGIQKM